MALAFGLMVGLAIAPGWGNAGSNGPVIALPGGEAATTGTTGEAVPETVASLQPPAGGETTTTAMATGDDSSSIPDLDTGDTTLDTSSGEEPVDPGDSTDDNYKEPPPDEEDPGEEPEAEPALVATVVGVNDAGYAVADSSGNLLFIHLATDSAVAPKVGRKIGTGIEPLDNGTFVQLGGVENRGGRTTTPLSGMVSWIDPESGVMTVSGRGASVAIDAAKVIAGMAEPPTVGSWVTGVVAFGGAKSSTRAESPATGETTEAPAEETAPDPITLPDIVARSFGEPGAPVSQIDLSGPVSWDSGSRILTIAADGFDALNREVEIAVPKTLPLKGIEDGMIYAASADIETDGSLTLAGLSANSNREAASDQKQAFGTHSR